jgi:hypothetical protein
MAKVTIANQTTPTTPSSAYSAVFVDSTTKKFGQIDDSGIVHGMLSRNVTTAGQAANFTTDTYVTNSGLLIPSSGLVAGMQFRWWVYATKSTGSTAAAVYTFRVGTGQATSDTSIIALTDVGAQTSAAANVLIICTLGLRTVSASGVGVAAVLVGPSASSTFGLGKEGVSSTIDLTGKAGQYVGLSINAGASATWTVDHVYAELVA